MAQTGEQPRGDGGGDGVRHSQGHRETRNEEAGRSPPEEQGPPLLDPAAEAAFGCRPPEL